MAKPVTVKQILLIILVGALVWLLVVILDRFFTRLFEDVFHISQKTVGGTFIYALFFIALTVALALYFEIDVNAIL